MGEHVSGSLIFFLLIMLSAHSPITAFSESHDAIGGSIDQINFNNAAQPTEYWQGYYGTISLAPGPDPGTGGYIDYGDEAKVGTIRSINIFESLSDEPGGYILATDSSSTPDIGNFEAGQLPAIDCITGDGLDSGSRTFIASTIFDTWDYTTEAPTAFTYADGLQAAHFRVGFLMDGDALVFIAPINASRPGYDSGLYDFQFIVPTNTTNPKTYHMYYYPEPEPDPIPTPTPTPTPPAPTPSGGGGGGASSESTVNIALRESVEHGLMKGKPVSYEFSAYRFTEPCNNIMFVNFTPKSTYSSVAVSVEVLYGTSTMVDVAPPGIVYQNINLWVGLAGFATERNMEVATVVFRVDRSWIDENDISLPTIQLFSYDRRAETWIPLPTVVSGMDSSYTYFKSETIRFGNLAIVSSSTKAARGYGIVPPLIRESDTESPTEEPDAALTATPSQTQSPTPTPTRKSSIPGLPAPGIMATMAMIGAAAWLMKRRSGQGR